MGNSNFDIVEIFGGNGISYIDGIINDMDKHVTEHKIAKRRGGTRTILAPDAELKYLQTAVYYKLLLLYSAHDAAHGFVKRKGIVTNAENHVKAKSIGHMDIENFFDTINKQHVSNCLFGNRNVCKLCKHHKRMLDGKCSPSLYHNAKTKYLNRCEEISAVYVKGYCEKNNYDSLFTRVLGLTIHNGSTPQGFPTSPFLANIVLKGFDKRVTEEANKYDVKYSRYADDLSISSKTMDKNELKDKFQTFISRALWGFGFAVNKKKTKWKDSGRLTICGIVVNEKTNLRRSDVMRFRAKVHHALVKDVKNTSITRIRRLRGWASYLMSANKQQGLKYMEKLKSWRSS